MDLIFNEAEILKAIETLHPENSLFEIRLIAEGEYRWTASGYFTDAGKAVAELKATAGKIKRAEYGYKPPVLPHIYITINEPVQADYARPQQDKFMSGKISTTQDTEIASINWVLIDADPVRPGGISSTNAEKAEAKLAITAIKEYLASKGFAEPIEADSGNGYHLIYKTALPADAAKQYTKPFIEAIAGKFSSDKVDIDKKVFNAARICKLYGSYAVKGREIPERPHRLSSIISVPENQGTITAEDMQAVIDELTPTKQAPKPTQSKAAVPSSKAFDFDSFIQQHNIEVFKQEPTTEGDGTRYLVNCPFDSSHKDATVTIFDSGVITYHCFHNSCSNYKWADYRAYYEPHYKAEQEQRQQAYEQRQWEYEQRQKQYSHIENGYRQHRASIDDIITIDDYDIEPPTQPVEPQAKRQAYEKENQASSYIDIMRAELEAERTLPELSTGFKSIDAIINGGLYAGLYFIGAISSLGKTTLALQMADAIARQGTDVLVISLEMAKRELIAKSISRITAQYSRATTGIYKELGRTTADIMNLKRQQGYYDESGSWVSYSESKRATIEATVNTAFAKYSDYANHIFIYEGIGDITPEKIKAKMAEHKQIYGKAPVLIIDYLQILQGDNSRDTDKTKTDKNVVELKRISRDYKVPVIAISSLNRSSYTEPISMESFKESGGIEYSSDILIGLQYKGYDYATDANGKREQEPARLGRIADINKAMREAAKAGEPQPIEVKILKNRNGNRGTASLNFYPMYNLFVEAEKSAVSKWDNIKEH